MSSKKLTVLAKFNKYLSDYITRLSAFEETAKDLI